jgi:hypothetical protein
MSQPLRWQWNEHEDAALHELQNHHAAILYLRGLRKHMDYDTGLVGIRRRISLRMFSELLEERRDPGSPYPQYIPTKASIRWALTRLEKVKLIERIPQTGHMAPMVFRLPLATIGIFKPEQHDLQHIATAHEEDKNNNQINSIENNNSTELQQEQAHSNKYPACPHQQILQIWNEVMPAQIRRPRETLWKPDRKAYKELATRWKQCFEIIHSKKGVPLYTDLPGGLQWWRGFFIHCTKSDFLMNRCRPFELTWVVNRENFIKIQEGKYHHER